MSGEIPLPPSDWQEYLDWYYAYVSPMFSDDFKKIALFILRGEFQLACDLANAKKILIPDFIHRNVLPDTNFSKIFAFGAYLNEIWAKSAKGSIDGGSPLFCHFSIKGESGVIYSPPVPMFCTTVEFLNCENLAFLPPYSRGCKIYIYQKLSVD